jgi:hypothetical protein
MNKTQTQLYYKNYYIKHKEYILKQKADFRKANKEYENQIREIQVVILDKKDGNKIREYFCVGIV